MILMAERIVKILVLITILLFLLKQLRIRGFKQVAGLLIVIAVFGVGALKCSTMAPSLKELVTIEALGEKSTDSGADEILLAGFLVDGEEISISRPSEGKWFWAGSYYMWRNEADSRQPAGTTRKVSFEIPVGWDRKVAVKTSAWSGKAAISCLDMVTEVDAYGTDNQVTYVSLPKTNSEKLMAQACIRIAAFAVAFAAASGLFYAVCLLWRKDPSKSKVWLTQNKANVGCALIAFAAFVFMRSFSNLESFWLDEIAEIGFSMDTTSALKALLVLHNSYYDSWAGDILSLWYRIAPWGASYLLIPTQIATAAGIYFIGLAGKVLRNERSAIVAAGIATVSTYLILQAGFEYRSYGFVFLGCSLAVWQYCRMRCAEKLTWKNIILFGIFMWMPAGCHVFGVFFCVPFFFVDLYLYIKGRLNIKAIWSYVITGTLYFPWLYNMFRYGSTSVTATWQGVPSLDAVRSLLQYLTSQNTILHLLFWIGLCLAIIRFIAFRDSCTESLICEFSVALIPCFVVGFVFCYGRFVNSTATMWMERYFSCLFPCIVLLITLAIDSILFAVKEKPAYAAGISAAIILSVAVQTLPTIKAEEANGYPARAKYQAAADWFYTQANVIYNDSTLILYCPVGTCESWEEYCLTKKGERDPLSVIRQSGVSEIDLQGKRLIYVYYEHTGIFDSTKQLLAELGFQETANNEQLKVATYTLQETSAVDEVVEQ